MRILLTRPQPDSEILAKRLRALGHDSQIEPLFVIDFFTSKAIALDGVQALLITSANGIEAFARNSPDRELAVCAVGNATARKARNLGFMRVESANGDVSDLARLVNEKLDPTAGILLHIAGSDVAGDLAAELGQAGFIYRRQVLYDARQQTELSSKTIDAISTNDIDAVLLYSPRTAKTLIKLVKQTALQDKTTEIVAYCLSPAVAKALDELPWKQCRIASEPTEEALIALIETA